ncbi:MAG: glycosyltransferase [Betaproteobacteria bacterium]|nr:glycosyltransferase [Betaproteobacteria bacterium]
MTFSLTIVGRALRYLRIFGVLGVARRLRAVLATHTAGFLIPFTPWCRSLPARSRPSAKGRPEILFFSGLEWYARFQRPQQLCLAFAHAGCRVHYCAPSSAVSWGKGWLMRGIDGDGRLWRCSFLARRMLTLHEMQETNAATRSLADTARRLANAVSGSGLVIALVEHPLWLPVLKQLQGITIVLDCLDDFAGFTHIHPDTRACEQEMAGIIHGVIATSEYLAQRWAGSRLPLTIVRNACDFQHFSTPPSDPALKIKGPVIGYHGAMEEWFDTELVEAAALACPEYTFLLVGGAIPAVAQRLKRLPNIIMTGEVPYAELPRYVHVFDVAILPFRIQPLTLCVNPVKVYEYLAAGLPVVAVPLPEVAQFGSLARIGQGEEFIRLIRLSVAGTNDAEARMAFAQRHSWDARAQAVLEFCASLPRGRAVMAD